MEIKNIHIIDIFKYIGCVLIIIAMIFLTPLPNKLVSMTKTSVADFKLYLNHKPHKYYAGQKLIDRSAKIIGDYGFHSYLYIDDIFSDSFYSISNSAFNYFAPAKTLRMSNYLSKVNFDEEYSLMKFIDDHEIDCLVVRKNILLEVIFNIKIDTTVGAVFAVNKGNTTSLKDMLTLIK